ncbi:hypothetical protein ABTW24_21285 [Sphingobacterium thalpophilum]|uniref:Uncharacterized protein n=1 Tax=Sphingobacterium thalpophilum TaxID=259 RepID=A0ABV4HI01_9SPHI
MKSIGQDKYQDNTDLTVNYPNVIWLLIASFVFGGVCWYLGYQGALADRLSDWSIISSYLFFVLMVAITFLYIRLVIVLLDKRQNWLTDPEKRIGTQLFFCCVLPTLFLFWIIGPDAMAKDEWFLFPLMVIFSGVLVLNMCYTVYFYFAIYQSQKKLLIELNKVNHQQQLKISDLEEQIDLLSPDLEEVREILEAETGDRDPDSVDEIDLVLVKSMDPGQEVFLLNNKILSQKILYKDLEFLLLKIVSSAFI